MPGVATVTLRQGAVASTALATLIVALVASVALGAEPVPFGAVLDSITFRAEPGPLNEIVMTLRLPRTVAALLVGAALGMAGALLQGALANPLASPDVIGVTGGAAFGAMLVLLAFPGAISLLPIGALAFGLVAAAIVFAVAWSGARVGAGSVGRLILAGIAVGAAFNAGTMALMTAYPDRVQSAVFWLAGGLTTEGWDAVRAVAPYIAVGGLVALVLMGPLDRLALGDDVAASLGTRPGVVRVLAGAAAALLASGAAALAGLLAFLGLVVPHVVRLAGGSASHRFVVPVSGVAGAALLVGGDTLARILLAPRELPVGPLMVVLGVPVFLWLLRKAT